MHRIADPALDVAGVHFFPFGSFAATARWVQAAAAGRLRLDESGFAVQG